MNPPCDRIQEDAAGLVSLGSDDPERRAAEAHAATCASCAAALVEAKAVLALVDRALPLAAPSATTLARARAEILRELAAAGQRFNGVPGASRTRRSPVAAVGVLGAVLGASWFIPASKHLAHGGPALMSALLAVAAAAIALATLLWDRRLLLALFPVCSLGVAAMAGGGLDPQAATGAKCAVLELALAVAPSALVLFFARGGMVGRPTLAVAAAASAGALVGQAVLHLACHAVPSIAHSMVFHSLPVLLALGLGALLGRTLGRRSASP